MRKWQQVVVCLVVAAGMARAQSVITTVAGTDWIFPQGSIAGLDAPLGLPTGLAFDAGRLVLLDYLNHAAFRLDPAGRVSALAGNGLGGFSGDNGPAINASLLYPRSCAIDHAGNLYIADSEGRAIRVVSPDGSIRTLTGAGGRRAPADGVPIAEAQFTSIISIAALPDGALALADDALARFFVSPQTECSPGWRATAPAGPKATAARRVRPTFACPTSSRLTPPATYTSATWWTPKPRRAPGASVASLRTGRSLRGRATAGAAVSRPVGRRSSLPCNPTRWRLTRVTAHC